MTNPIDPFQSAELPSRRRTDSRIVGLPSSGVQEIPHDDPAIETLRIARGVVGSLDALIRTIRTNVPGTEGIAGRIANQWQSHPNIVVHFEATALAVNSKVLLRSSREDGRWVLPSFMAGVRKISSTEDCKQEDVHSLASELGGLEPTPESLDRFGEWLWSDGLDGFKVDLQSSFAEALETTYDDIERERNAISMIRMDMAAALSQRSAPVALRDLDLAQFTEEFQLPIDVLMQGASANAFAMSEEDGLKLRNAFEDPVFWVTEEMSLVLGCPEFQTALPPRALARQLVRLAMVSFDRRFLAVVAALGQVDTDYARRVLVALEDEPIGEAIASKAPLDPAGLKRLEQLLHGQSARIAAGVVRGLLVRGALEGETLDTPIATLASTLGAQKLLDYAALVTLAPQARPVLGRVLVRIKGGAELLSELLSKLQQADALEIIQIVPNQIMPQLAKSVGALLKSANTREKSLLAGALLDKASVACVVAAGEVLVADHAVGWELRTVRLIAQFMITKNADTIELLKMMRSSQTPIEVRVMLLNEMAASHMADEVLRWRLGELLDPPAIQSRLAELRKEGGR